MSDPASVLAHLIEFGSAPTPEASWPWVWVMAHEAVSAVHGSRAERWAKFEETIYSQPDFFELRGHVMAAVPIRENRERQNRFIYSAADAFGSPPAVDWCVEGLFARPSLNILVGDPGSKKTLLALDLAVCVASGKPWLGHPVTACPTLIVDEETGKPRLWARIHGALLAHQAQPEIPFHYMSLASFDLRDPAECGQLQQAAESVSAGLIVIDALVDVIRGSDENSVLALQPFFTRMRQLAEATHSAVLILHHNNKSGSFRGSSVISAGVDLLLSIESLPDSPLVHLRPLKTRNAAPEPFTAQVHFSGDQFHFTQSNEKPIFKIPAAVRQNTATAILDLLAESPADTQFLVANLPGISLGTIRNVLHQLKLSGLVERADGGSMGAKATYRLSVKGLELLIETRSAGSNHDDD